MKELDELRAAMHTHPAIGYGPLDAEAIMAGGRRIRRKRQALIVGGIATTTAAAVIGVVTLIGLPFGDAPPGMDPAMQTTDGRFLVSTGMWDARGEIVIYSVADDGSRGPEEFTLVAAHRSASGELLDSVMAPTVPQSAPLRAFYRGMLEGQVFPAFGAYAGPAEKITGMVGTKTVTARLVVWPQRPDIKIFWFPLADVPSTTMLTDITGYDAAGKPLPVK
ncbi:hypothetical protein [Kibdelosporangium aridum]|uniref:Uncharacterized protein n=1 Tax=Kibdelosporangium aridum TaxID=2030 RepID=A0A1W2FW83_KIBAR|nr:hypothetical protein [Kibdelosporangium aridum]SMD25992.1 hypothetical protein SAMN05661093_09570 [Kibdelosporangium aridum]